MALPFRVTPIQPTLVQPFHRDGWVYEEKYDGWRIVAYKDGQRVRLVSWGGRDHATRFPGVAAAVAALPAPSLILDGKLCAFDRHLVSHLHLLQDAGDELAPSVSPPVYVAFDCLSTRGHDLRRHPLSQRRENLEDEIAGSDVLLARRFPDDGFEAWAEVERRGYEGLIAKPDASAYVEGAWKKIKLRREGAFHVLGVLEGSGRFGGVVVGRADPDDPQPADIVEYGFSRLAVAELLVRARPLVRRRSTLDRTGETNVLWLKPTLLALVMYSTLVNGRLREPAYRGLLDAERT